MDIYNVAPSKTCVLVVCSNDQLCALARIEALGAERHALFIDLIILGSKGPHDG